MKALSIRQPWIWAIMHGGKRIENRKGWPGCSYRGPVLLHAAKGVGTLSEFDANVTELAGILMSLGEAGRVGIERFRAHLVDGARDNYNYPGPELARAGIVGRARIDGFIRTEADFAAYAANVTGGREQRAWWDGDFALVLADVEPLPFIPWKGSLGLFEVPDGAFSEALGNARNSCSHCEGYYPDACGC